MSSRVYRQQEARRQWQRDYAKRRRDLLRAALLCINGEGHDAPHAGVRCDHCVAIHRGEVCPVDACRVCARGAAC